MGISIMRSSRRSPSHQMRVLNVLSVLILVATTSHQASSSTLPVNSSGVLLCGGSTTDHHPYLVTCEVYNSSCSVPSLPTARTAHSLVVTKDGLILACGGRGHNGQDDLSC